jgi:hypothetical protein
MRDQMRQSRVKQRLCDNPIGRKLSTLETPEVQQLLNLSGLKVTEDLAHLKEFSVELNDLEKLKEDLIQVSHDLNALKRGQINGPTSPHSEMDFFGAHNQVVSELGARFKQTGTASDYESIEAAESKFGVPIITTQFHPEVGAKGLPNIEFIYKRTAAEQEMNLDIFRYLNKASDAYSKKKTVMNELEPFNPKKTNEINGVDVTPNIKPSVLKARNEQQKPQEPVCEKQSSSKQEKSPFFGNLFSAIGSFFKDIGSTISQAYRAKKNTIKQAVGNLLRYIISNRLTNARVSSIRKKEKESSSSEDLDVEKDKVVILSSSFSTIYTDIKAKAPSEILRETPAKLWTKQEDELGKTGVKTTEIDKTGKVDLSTTAPDHEEDPQLDKDQTSRMGN